MPSKALRGRVILCKWFDSLLQFLGWSDIFHTDMDRDQGTEKRNLIQLPGDGQKFSWMQSGLHFRGDLERCLSGKVTEHNFGLLSISFSSFNFPFPNRLGSFLCPVPCSCPGLSSPRPPGRRFSWCLPPGQSPPRSHPRQDGVVSSRLGQVLF